MALRVSEQELRDLLVTRLEVIDAAEFEKARTMAARLRLPLELPHVPLDDPAPRGRGPGEDHPEAVEDVAPGEIENLMWDIGTLRFCHKRGNLCCDPHDT